MPALLFDGPESSALRLVLAHGAGAGMSSPFMSAMAAELGVRGVRVARFEFPYMQRRKRGVRAPPDRMPVLLDSYRAVVSQLGAASQLVIGGKSMGGRVASMLADELGVAGLVCLGYPFHPAKRPERTRTGAFAGAENPDADRPGHARCARLARRCRRICALQTYSRDLHRRWRSLARATSHAGPRSRAGVRDCLHGRDGVHAHVARILHAHPICTPLRAACMCDLWRQSGVSSRSAAPSSG